jgi:uncharacterized protein (DUF488 family)
MIASPTKIHPIFTVGHSTLPLEGFLELLQQNGITAVADVRSTPFSRWQPQFNLKILEAGLKEVGIAYVFLGKELGGRSSDPSCYKNGRVQYRQMAKTELFSSGLRRVVEGSQRYRIALMCAEREPLECHRAILISRELVTIGKTVNHIHDTGAVETHSELVLRLLNLHGLPRQDLFRSSNEFADAAYARQEERIAYTVNRDNRSKQVAQG